MAKISEITFKMGVKDTADDVTGSIELLRSPFIIGNEIYKYNPNKHQALAWVHTHGRYRSTASHNFKHAEKTPLPEFVQFNGADEATQGTTGLAFANGGSRLTTYSRIYNCRTGEVIRLNADMSTNSTGAVTRNFGTSGTPLIKKGDWFKILPKAHTEGRTMGEGQTGGEKWYDFLTSIVDWPVQLTGTKAAEKSTEGDPYMLALSDAWDSAEDQLEAELLFGAKVEDDSTYTYPLHVSEGLLNWISTHVWSINGSLSRWLLWDIIQEWTMWNKEGGAIWTSSQVIHVINSNAIGKVEYRQDMAYDGISFRKILTPASAEPLDLVEVDLLSHEPHLAGMMIFVPNTGKKQGIDIRPLVGNENREIAYKPVTEDEKDLKQGVIFGEQGYELWGEERFAVATDIEF